MYAFLIVITIILPSLTPTKEPGPPVKYIFSIFTHDQYAQPICVKRATETAERAVEYTRRRMPFAIITTEASCTLLVTRQT